MRAERRAERVAPDCGVASEHEARYLELRELLADAKATQAEGERHHMAQGDRQAQEQREAG
jgi:hypothetical protein